jgi:hypothetical protein
MEMRKVVKELQKINPASAKPHHDGWSLALGIRQNHSPF